MFKRILFLNGAAMLLALNPGTEALAQSEQLPENVVNRSIPADPEAGNLGKYGNYTLNYATGQVGISVPLFELKGVSLNYAVGLSYDHQGIRVEDRATSAGANWNLSAMGTISRTINGLPDEKASLGFNANYQMVNGGTLPPSLYSPANMNDPWFRAALGLIDLQPDEFSFSFNGRSGKFFYDPAGDRFLCMPYSKLRIEKMTSATGGFDFKITDENGYQYFFDLKVKTDVNTTGNAMNESSSSEYCQWYLTKILSANGQTEFEFEFQADNNLQTTSSDAFTRTYLLSSTGASTPGSSCQPYTADIMYQVRSSTLYTGVNTRSLLISRIRSPFEDLKIDYAPRTDESMRISKMTLLRKNNAEKQNWTFYHSYYSGGGKLRLDSLSLFTGANKINGYVFGYEDGSIPARSSKAKDYWGFAYNLSATSLFPKIWYVNQYIGDVDRSPTLFTKNGTLNRITYPTGGYTAFEYELNDYGKIGATLSETPTLTPATVSFTRRRTQQGIGTTEQVFTLAFATIVHFESRRDNCDGTSTPGNPGSNCSIEPCQTVIELLQPDGSTVSLNGAVTQWKTADLNLPAGTYKLRITTNELRDYGTVSATYNAITYTGVYKNKAGGLRIKTIRNYDGIAAAPVVRKFSYLSTDRPYHQAIYRHLPCSLTPATLGKTVLLLMVTVAQCSWPPATRGRPIFA